MRKRDQRFETGNASVLHEVAPTTRSVTRPLRMDRSVFESIRREIGLRRAEEGGPLGGSRESDIVTHFYFDGGARRSGASYSPDHLRLNKLFKEQWNPRDINMLGVVHSHPPGFRRPSWGDVIYAEEILKGIPELDRLQLPIVMTEPNTGSFELLPFVAYRTQHGIEVERVELIIPEADADKRGSQIVRDNATTLNGPSECYSDDDAWSRVRSAYHQPRLSRVRILKIGEGGSSGLTEDLARTGIGQFVLMDEDTVAPPNLATQQTYRSQMGVAKVEASAARIRDINPEASVIPLARMLDDDLSDAQMEHLLNGELDGFTPELTLLCGFTDDFYAQARVHRLALQFNTPSLCSQMYREGRAAEVSFTFPGITPACHRCATASRYKAYLHDGFRNDVTSHGSPIFATTRLNSICGFVAMAILHHGTDHPRFGGLLKRIGDRNLIQVRMDPDLAGTLGVGAFDRVLAGADQTRLCFDDTIWLPQKPDNPDNGFLTCSDCGGTGDLRDSVGTFDDTRIMRK